MSASLVTLPIYFNIFQDELFFDKEGGGYFNTPGEDPSVLLRVKEDHDGAEPSGNSVSVINLVRLASMVAGSRSEQYRKNAEHLLVRFFSLKVSFCQIESEFTRKSLTWLDL